MNIVQLQDQLKNFSQDQLVREMQAPSGNAPQFLVLGEIMRRKRMQDDFKAQQSKDDGGTVAQEAVAAAGVPQGGIADMARAMAPSTDMTQNTGVQAMYAGGFVKKMAPGGKAKSGVAKTDPAVIAMANRAGMSVSQYLDALGEEEAARIEADAAQRAERNRMMAMDPVGDGATFPPQTDLDRRFQEEQFAFGASRPLATPAAIDMPTIPAAAGLPAISAAPETPGAPFFLRSRDVAPEAGTTPTFLERMRGESQMSPQDEEPAPPALDPFEMRKKLASTYQGTAENAVVPTGEGQLFDFDTSPQAPKSTFDTAPLLPIEIDRPGLYSAIRGQTEAAKNADALLREGKISSAQYERLTKGSRAEQGDVIREMLRGEDGETLSAPQTNAEIIAATAPGLGPAFEQRGREQSPTTPEEAAVAQEAAKKAADEAEKAKTTTSPDAPSGGAGGAGGAGGMSSYEQELMSMLQKREKAAEQDKWLALAQVGLNLMSSTQPTLGGALGEAGLKGVEAARSARDQYDKDRLELMGALEQSRAARAKAAGGGGLTAYQAATLGRYARQDAMSYLGTLYDRLGDVAPGGVPLPQNADEFARIQAEIAGIQNELYGGGAEAESGEAIDVRTKT